MVRMFGKNEQRRKKKRRSTPLSSHVSRDARRYWQARTHRANRTNQRTKGNEEEEEEKKKLSP